MIITIQLEGRDEHFVSVLCSGAGITPEQWVKDLIEKRIDNAEKFLLDGYNTNR